MSDDDVSENLPGAARKEAMGGLAKGLEVLLSFGRDSAELTLSEIAEKTALAPATARRCLLTLQELGYVRVSRRRFFLTPKVLDLSATFLEALDIERLAVPHLEELAKQTGDSASFTVLQGSDIVYLARASARMLMRLEAHVGSRFPAFATATGRVLLAAKTEERLAELLAPPLPALTDLTVTDPARLREILATVRREGYSVVVDELAYGVISLAAPIVDSTGRVIAAVNSSGHSRRTDATQMIEDRLDIVRETAQQLSNALARVPQIGLMLTGEE